MNSYKRNQVEDAICLIFAADDERARELKLRLKRLLVTDRRLVRKKERTSVTRFLVRRHPDLVVRQRSPIMRHSLFWQALGCSSTAYHKQLLSVFCGNSGRISRVLTRKH